LPVPIDLERELHLQHRSGIVADLDSHLMTSALAIASHRVPRHICQRPSCFFLHSFNGREFKTLFVEIVAFSNIKIITGHVVLTF